MAYKGKWKPKNPSKYAGDASNITYRSLWERQTFRWLDENSDVVSWSSEEVVIPYLCKTDGRLHRYFVDIKMTLANGQTYIIEIKPEKETKPPKTPKKRTRRFVTEVMTYAKNHSKWEAAEKYAKQRNWVFEIWTEKSLKKLGIVLLSK